MLPHVRNRLSAQSTHAQLCVGYWSRGSLIKNSVIMAEAVHDDLEEPEDLRPDGWDDVVVAL